MKNNLFKRILALVLAVAAIAAYLPTALDFQVSAAASSYTKVADGSTIDSWKKLFGKETETLTTEFAGAVQFDKSVFTDINSFLTKHNDSMVSSTEDITADKIAAMDDDSFLVALSAIASNKSIVGYSTVPTDTMLVLDVSGSMRNAQGQNYAADELADAANLAITELLALNNHNRVGVVLYSGDTSSSAKVLMPLDRYTVNDTDTVNDTTVGQYLIHSGSGNNEYITLNTDKNDGVKDSSGKAMSEDRKQVLGSTFIQNGIYMAMEEFLSVEDTVIEGGKFQAGTTRMPVMVLMSDGAPTVATNYFNGYTANGDTNNNANGIDNPPDGIGNANFGNGSSKNTGLAFLSQLTAAYAKTKIDAHYKDTTPLFYTLGLGVSNAATAQDVLNPSANTDDESDVNTYWAAYEDLGASDILQVKGNKVWERQETGSSGNNGSGKPNRPGDDDDDDDDDDYEWVEVDEIAEVSKDTQIDITSNRYYVDKYFDAESADALVGVFDNIIQQIILQSLYRPTLVESGNDNLDGYVEIVDDIGEYMDVKDIKGVVLGDNIFTGEQLSQNFNTTDHNLGTIANPSDLGNNMIWAIIERLGIDGTYAEQVTEARNLVGMAFQDGQLSYTSPGNYSNYIGWYADGNGEYISFWDKDHVYADVPANAAYVNKSYGLMGEVTDGIADTDMMYISIQVHTAIDQSASALSGKIETGAQQVIWKVPAALIPMVSYNVEIEGVDSLEGITDESEINVEIKETDPIRLLFEVGLKDEINPFTVSDIVDARDVEDANTIIAAASGTTPAAGSEAERVALNEAISVTQDDNAYSFYTNKWNTYTVNKGNTFPSDEVNTVGFFEPSEENERYYYAEDTKLYVKDGSNFIPYTGDTLTFAEDTYYHMHHQFVKGTDNKWKYETTYEVSTEFAVNTAIANGKQDDGGWYIPKGTPHRTTFSDSYINPYNNTNTLPDYAVPLMEYHGNTDPTYYYFDAILGNNGKITVNAETGIKLSKETDGTIADTTQKYTFEITAPDDISLTDAKVVTFDEATETAKDYDATITADKITVELKAGEEAYIAGLAPDTTYTVTELVENSDSYKVSQITVEGAAVADTDGNDAQVTVTEGDIKDVEFTNTFDGKAALVIDKIVTHDMSIAPSALNTKEFEITIVQEPKDGAVGQTVVTAISNKKDINTISFTESNGIYTATYNIVNDETIELIFPFDNQGSYELTVSEATYPKFTTTVNGQTTNEVSGNLTADSNMVVNVVNNYKTDDSINITEELIFTGTKEFTGRAWNENDRFEFKLEEYVPQTENGQYIGMIWEEVTDTPAAGDSIVNSEHLTFDLGDAFSKIQPFTSTGTHLYRVTEINDGKTGITYDGRAFEFEVTVTDNDMDGELEISDVSSATMTVTEPQTEGEKWNVAATFKNSYKAVHGVEVTFNINKSVTTSSGAQYSPEGFEFGLYSTDSSFNIPTGATPIGAPITTDAHGDAIISNLIYLPALLEDANDINTYYYAIAETNSGIDNMEYINKIPVTVRVYDAGDGYLAADVTVGSSTGTNANGAGSVTVAQGEYNTTVNATAQNYFTSPKVDITLSGTKTVNAATPAKEYGTFSFVLKEAKYDDTSGITVWNVKETVSTNAGSSDFSFSKIEYSAIGNHTYRISEVDPQKDGMTYDKSVYEVNVAVEDSGENNGTMKTTVTTKRIADANGNTLTTPEAITSNSVAFNNIYDAEDVSVVLEGVKQVNGAEPGDTYPGFTFRLAGNGNTFTSQPNGEDGKFSINLGTFTETGTYTYTLKEVLPEYEGYDYDLSEYEVTVNISDTENDLKNGVLKATATVKQLKDRDGNAVTDTAKAVTVNNSVIASDIVFNNLYSPCEAKLTLEGEKVLNGRELKDDEFTFLLEEENETDTAVKAKNKDGKFTFELSFDKDDIGNTITYLLREETGNSDGVTYDKSVYKVVIEISDADTTNGTVDIKTSISKIKDKDGKDCNESVITDKADTKISVLSFENTYTPEPPANTDPPASSDTPEVPNVPNNSKPPYTGDSGVVLYTVIMAICAAGIGLVLYKKVKSK